MIYTKNNELRTTIFDDGTVEAKLHEILIVMNNKTFGQREAADIVGGRGRLFRLVGEGKIRAEKPTKVQNGKWFCNASDVLRYARRSYRKKRTTKKKNNETVNQQELCEPDIRLETAHPGSDALFEWLEIGLKRIPFRLL